MIQLILVDKGVKRVKKTGLLVMLLLVSVVVLSFTPMAFAGSAANEQQAVWENRQVNEWKQLKMEQFAQANEQKQLRLQECGGVCDDACEPKQNRLQKNEQLNEKKEQNRQQKLTMSKNIGKL